MTVSATGLILFLATAATSYATLPSSPETQVNPLADAQMFVTGAGTLAQQQAAAAKPLFDGSRICLEKFPFGFSIRCNVAQDTSSVWLYIDGVRVIRERHAPFFIAGYFANGRVGAWDYGTGEMRVICKYGWSRRDSISIKIVVGC